MLLTTTEVLTVNVDLVLSDRTDVRSAYIHNCSLTQLSAR
jgi:hypothetical protein